MFLLDSNRHAVDRHYSLLSQKRHSKLWHRSQSSLKPVRRRRETHLTGEIGGSKTRMQGPVLNGCNHHTLFRFPFGRFPGFLCFPGS